MYISEQNSVRMYELHSTGGSEFSESNSKEDGKINKSLHWSVSLNLDKNLMGHLRRFIMTS